MNKLSSMVLSRRDVLQGGLALGLAPALGPIARWGTWTSGFTCTYFSDTHVSLGRNVAECRAMLDEILAGGPPAFAINGGDVTDYGWAGEYDNYDALLRAFGVPTYHVPGNHDVRWSPLGLKIFENRVGEPYRTFEHHGVHFVLLDSTVPLAHWGHYETQQLRWLERRLQDIGREAPVILATHHWVGRDRVMIDNEQTLAQVIEPYNVPFILTGHGHSDLLWEWEGTACTMNRGLYQGSYQRLEFDMEAKELRVARRTAEQPELTALTTRSLRPSSEKRPVWALATASILAGTPLRVGLDEVREAKWPKQPWRPLVNGSVPTDDLIPGDNPLGLRDRAGGREETRVVRVEDPNAPLQPRWRRQLTGGVMSQLRLEGERLLVSAMDGTITVFDANDGRQLWRAETGGYCHSSPVVEGDLVVVGSADGSAYGFDLATGERRWSFATAGPVYSSATFAKGVGVIASGDGRVYGFEPATGQVQWTYTLPQSNTAFIQSPGASDGERVYFGAWDNYLYCLDPVSGELLWRAICSDRTFAFSPAIGGPATAPGRVVVPANGNNLYCFDARFGHTIWETVSPGDKFGYSSPRIVGDRIYIGCLGDAGEVRCVDLKTGTIIWTATTGEVIYDSSPAVADGFVSIGSVDALLSVIRAEDGGLVGQYRMPRGHFLSSPAARPGWVYAATYSDWVVAFEVIPEAKTRH